MNRCCDTRRQSDFILQEDKASILTHQHIAALHQESALDRLILVRQQSHLKIMSAWIASPWIRQSAGRTNFSSRATVEWVLRQESPSESRERERERVAAYPYQAYPWASLGLIVPVAR